MSEEPIHDLNFRSGMVSSWNKFCYIDVSMSFPGTPLAQGFWPGVWTMLPGQRLSACTCPGEDHPGPNVGVGRGAPEIDVIEAQIDSRGIGSASQSVQIAPFDAGYRWKNTSDSYQMFDPEKTFQNAWQGSVYQESISVITLGDATSYEDAGYISYDLTKACVGGTDGFSILSILPSE
ncbi:hypothetical protein RQP46_000984 [Phenoliferia psychrophenolica]